MRKYDAKKQATPIYTSSKKPQSQSECSPYDGLIQMASLVGNSAMEAYLRQGQTPQTNALTTEIGGQELPPSLRERMEFRFGMPLDDVRVHYNSDKPASFMARAFAKGSEKTAGLPILEQSRHFLAIVHHNLPRKRRFGDSDAGGAFTHIQLLSAQFLRHNP